MHKEMAAKVEVPASSDRVSRLRDELDLLDRETTAAVLRVEPRTLDDWRRKEIGPPSMKIGGRIFYRRISIQRWLEQIEESPGDLRSSLAVGGRTRRHRRRSS